MIDIFGSTPSLEFTDYLITSHSLLQRCGGGGGEDLPGAPGDGPEERRPGHGGGPAGPVLHHR